MTFDFDSFLFLSSILVTAPGAAAHRFVLVEDTVELILPMTAEIVKTASSINDDDDDANNAGGLSRAMTSHIICCLDLLSATYDGLADAAAQYATKFHLLSLLHATLTAQFFDQRASCFLSSDNK